MSSDHSKDAVPHGGAIDVSSRDGFEVEVQRPAPGVIVLRVGGALDLWTSLPLLDAILDAFRERPELIVVDMSDVLSVDDTGLRMLADGSGRVEQALVRFAIVAPPGSPPAGRLRRADAHRRLVVHESLDEALRPPLDVAGELSESV
jgi:anti-anti-sigma factor